MSIRDKHVISRIYDIWLKIKSRITITASYKWRLLSRVRSYEVYITVTLLWMQWRLKSTASRVFTQPFVQAQIREAFVRGIHRWPVHAPRKRPVTRKLFPFDDVIVDEANYWLATRFLSDQKFDFHPWIFPFLTRPKTCIMPRQTWCSAYKTVSPGYYSLINAGPKQGIGCWSIPSEQITYNSSHGQYCNHKLE